MAAGSLGHGTPPEGYISTAVPPIPRHTPLSRHRQGRAGVPEHLRPIAADPKDVSPANMNRVRGFMVA
jgi:hypothetical protein